MSAYLFQSAMTFGPSYHFLLHSFIICVCINKQQYKIDRGLAELTIARNRSVSFFLERKRPNLFHLTAELTGIKTP